MTALTPPTPAEFRAEYPEFTPEIASDTSVERAAGIAVRLTSLNKRAAIAATAHILTLEKMKGTAPAADGGAGEVSGESKGPFRTDYVTMASARNRSDTWWAVTIYGREYLMLRNSNPKYYLSAMSF